ICCNRGRVCGLSQPYKAKLNGVITTAARLDIAVMVTDTATFPFAIQVITLEKVPPGQDATRIMPRANSAGTRNTQVTRQVASGSNRNWAIKPAIGAFGSRSKRVKSCLVSCSDTPNIINAMAAFIATRSALLKSMETLVMVVTSVTMSSLSGAMHYLDRISAP